MSSVPLRLRAAPAVLAVSLLLTGCVSLFPKTVPVQLYRLSQAAPAPAARAPAGFALARAPISFPTDAEGDRLLTVSGQEAAFIADARWLQPAAVMFEEVLVDAFDQPGSPRLVGRGENLATGATLRLEVRRFETDYDKGQAGPPTVEITVHALLIRNADHSAAAETLIQTRQTASDNRVAAIVAAYNSAVAQSVGAVRDWTTANAGSVQP
jgi:cholesterol transport system auxiliary component